MNSLHLRLCLFLALWALAATAAGAFHLFAHLSPPLVPLLVAGLSIGFSMGVARVAWMKDAAASLGIRTILSAHLIRFIGLWFLWLQTQGRLPTEFAQRAGNGDVAAGAGALALLFWPESRGFRRALFWWNILGAVDLLVAVGTAGWLNVTRPESMIELADLPLVLVPLFAVPVLLTSHLYLLRRHVCSRQVDESDLRRSRRLSEKSRK